MPSTSRTLWYQDAIIYQIHVRAFFDSNGDGIGDFRGLTQKLPYLEELGVTALWLLPFYPSPLRDDGYDIADYTDVNPSYGTLQDFDQFLQEAHQRGLRVITELILNHTSDQHEWFQRARRSPQGSLERDYYVWSETPDKYPEARVIFQDFELSNWSWDSSAKAYYWHRFFHHQPDLNWDQPAVSQAMFDVMDFWLQRGVDGVRLDAVPYLFQRDGTTCENLPETHATLKRLRQHIDSRYENRMLLAEANQWPEDAVAYFGGGDECHMAFHFPLMPRLFMAVQREDRHPIIDILQQTPAIPDNCQWTTFLRNHDELTLEMVTDEERDYMFRAYAEDPQARLNLGIRRRLAPLMKNDRRRIELLNGLLFTLLGTPVIYYGDELGMGDNIYLGDRHSVRTPMQWSSDRNAGFSAANPQKLYLPAIVDPEFHYATLNVETQEDNHNSLLWWMRRLISLRKEVAVFGHGSLEFLLPDNPKVLAFLREHDKQSVLVVANLSRFTQYVELDLSRFDGDVPVELFGKTPFPPIGRLPYLLTLGPYAFELFLLQSASHAPASISERALPTEQISDDWQSLMVGSGRRRLESALPHFLKQQSWFQGRRELIRSVTIETVIPLVATDVSTRLYWITMNVEYGQRDPEAYAIPISWAHGPEVDDLVEHQHERIILRLASDDDTRRGLMFDASDHPVLHEWWHDCVQPEGLAKTTSEQLEFLPSTQSFTGLNLVRATSAPVQRVTSDWVRLGEDFILRRYRPLEPASSPILETDQFLSTRAPKGLVPQWLGAWIVRPPDSEVRHLLASMYRYVPHESTAEELAINSVHQFIERMETGRHTLPADLKSHRVTSSPIFLGVGDEQPSVMSLELMGTWLRYAQQIGETMAELHRVLSSSEQPPFQPQPSTPHYQRSLFQSMRARAMHARSALQQSIHAVTPESQQIATQLVERFPAVIQIYERLLHQHMSVLRIRCHGNYRLGSLLFTGTGFATVDLQGDLRQPVDKRRIRQPVVADLASLFWSLVQVSEYAAESVLDSPGARVSCRDEHRTWMDWWLYWTTVSVVQGYRSETGAASLFLNTEEFRDLLKAWVLDLGVIELSNQLQNLGTVQTKVVASLLRLIPDEL